MSDEGRKGRREVEVEPTTPRQFWLAVAAGTAFSVGSFWVIFIGAIALSGDVSPGPVTVGGIGSWGGRFNADASASLWFGGGLALLPTSFYVMARLSTSPVRARSVVNASLLAIGLWVWLPVVTGEPLTPTVAAFGVGGTIVLGYHSVRKVGFRVVAVLFVTVYVYLFFGIIPWVALLLGPIAPLPAIGWADRIAARRVQQLGQRDEGRRAGSAREKKAPAPKRGRRAAPARQAPQRRGRSSVKRRR